MSTLVNQVGNVLEGVTGSGTFVGSNMPTMSSPTFNQINFNTSPGLILDENGHNMLGMTATASAVNYVNITNNVTGSAADIAAVGSDTNIYLALAGKGTFGVAIYGTKAADQAGVGVVGEVITSNVPFGSAISFTNNVTQDITSISLTPGDWDVFGNVVGRATTIMTQFYCWVNTVSATTPDISNTMVCALSTNFAGFPAPVLRVNITTTTTVYLTSLITGTGTLTACGAIYARRVR